MGRCSQTSRSFRGVHDEITGSTYSQRFPLVPFDNQSLNSFVTTAIPQLQVLCQVPLEVEDIYPGVPMQQGILLSQAKALGTYAVEYIWKVKAARGIAVDVGRLRQAYVLVVRRHPVPRTGFLEELTDDGLYDQVVL